MAISSGGKGPGTLKIKGSDTMLQLVSNFAEAYMENHPKADIIVEGGGSGTGIAALIDGGIDIANASRKMDQEEVSQAESNGITPWEFIIGRDAISIIVHPSNSVDNLTVEELSGIYRGNITNWEDVGGEDRQITLYGRRSTSGTYVYFRDHIVKADYSDEMYQMTGNQAIVDSVKSDETGIGYVGVGYVTTETGDPIDGVKILNVAIDENSESVSPLDPYNVKTGEYPIARPLQQYTAGKPEEGSLIYKFLKFELSKEGEQIIIDTGFYPITPADNAQNAERFAEIGEG